MSLSREEVAKAKFTFSIYDFEGINKMDATQLGNALRALNLNPTLKRISDLGGTKHRNEKLFTVEEFLAIYEQAKNDKKEGCWEDYMEVLSGQDKDKSGYLSVETLEHMLQTYGEEKLDRDEAEEVIDECGAPYDGLVHYGDFLKKLIRGPEIKIPISMLYAAEKNCPAKDGDAPADDPNVEMNIGGWKTPISQFQGFDTGCEDAEATFAIGRRSAKPNDSYSTEHDENLSEACAEFSITSNPKKCAKNVSSTENNATSSEINDANENDSSAASSSTAPKKRGVKKPKSGAKQDTPTSPEPDATAETSSGEFSGARNMLKSKSTRPVNQNPPKPLKARDEPPPPPVAAKHQQALISLKTQGLFGNSK